MIRSRPAFAWNTSRSRIRRCFPQPRRLSLESVGESPRHSALAPSWHFPGTGFAVARSAAGSPSARVQDYPGSSRGHGDFRIAGWRRRLRACKTVDDPCSGRSRRANPAQPASPLHGRLVHSRRELPCRFGWGFVRHLADLVGKRQASRPLCFSPQQRSNRPCIDSGCDRSFACMVPLREALRIASTSDDTRPPRGDAAGCLCRRPRRWIIE